LACFASRAQRGERDRAVAADPQLRMAEN